LIDDLNSELHVCFDYMLCFDWKQNLYWEESVVTLNA
jgi:hypothetical protein